MLLSDLVKYEEVMSKAYPSLRIYIKEKGVVFINKDTKKRKYIPVTKLTLGMKPRQLLDNTVADIMKD